MRQIRKSRRRLKHAAGSSARWKQTATRGARGVSGNGLGSDSSSPCHLHDQDSPQGRLSQQSRHSLRRPLNPPHSTIAGAHASGVQVVAPRDIGLRADAAPLTTKGSTPLRVTGLYVQDQIALNDRFNLMLGARYDEARENMENPGFPSTASDDDKLSPRVGLVYTLSPGRSAYAGYTQSFSDANNSSNGQSLKSIEAEQYEIGFKAETPDKRLFTTLAIYNQTKQNIVVPDPADATRSVQIGEARSRGLEGDIGGRLTPHLDLAGSYSYTDAKVTRDLTAPGATTNNEGHHLYGVPRHAGKLFPRYDEKPGGAQGLSADVGLAALRSQQGDTANSVQIPGYARVDLMGSYQWRTPGLHWTAQLNVIDVGDKTYYLPSGARDEIAYGKPLTVFAALRLTP